MEKRLFVFGFGYSARAIARATLRLGWRVMGTSRDAARFKSIADADATPIDYKDVKSVRAALDIATGVLVTAGTTESGCPVFADYGALVAGAAPRWIGYLSSNSVYGDHAGAWVDEDSELRASSARGLARIAAERQWLSLDGTVVFRLPGIYGPGRSALDQARAGAARRIVKPGQRFSRAHVDDIATAVVASMAREHQSPIFNVADDEPAPPQDVVAYACRLLGIEPPPEEAFETAQMSEMARSFYADNKQVSSARMKRELGVVLAYPTYREGLAAILAAGG